MQPICSTSSWRATLTTLVANPSSGRTYRYLLFHDWTGRFYDPGLEMDTCSVEIAFTSKLRVSHYFWTAYNIVWICLWFFANSVCVEAPPEKDREESVTFGLPHASVAPSCGCEEFNLISTYNKCTSCFCLRWWSLSVSWSLMSSVSEVHASSNLCQSSTTVPTVTKPLRSAGALWTSQILFYLFTNMQK